jgi:hypothetical protein
VRSELFKKAGRSGYCQLKLPIGDVKPAIYGHAEFTAFTDSVTKLFAKWKKANTPLLKGFAQDGRPKALIETIAESLLAICRDGLHGWLLRIVGASTAPTSMALPCRWRSRPQHQNRNFTAWTAARNHE